MIIYPGIPAGMIIGMKWKDIYMDSIYRFPFNLNSLKLVYGEEKAAALTEKLIPGIRGRNESADLKTAGK